MEDVLEEELLALLELLEVELATLEEEELALLDEAELLALLELLEELALLEELLDETAGPTEHHAESAKALPPVNRDWEQVKLPVRVA